MGFREIRVGIMLKRGKTGFPIDVLALRLEDVHIVCHGAHIYFEGVLCGINGEDLLFRHPVFINAGFIFDVFLIEPQSVADMSCWQAMGLMIHVVAYEASEANEVHGVADVFVVECNGIRNHRKSYGDLMA